MAYTTIDKPDDYFNTVLYTGTGATLSITGVGFQPDWVWIKERNAAADHGLYDAVRGVTEQLESNTTTAETTEATGLTAFGTDGFTVGALAQLNTSGDTYVAWNWLANGAGVSNSDGTITSTASANTTSGFSIVSYTGTGASATVGHGLGAVPNFIIVKGRSGTDAVDSWYVYHSSVGNTKFLELNSTIASTTNSGVWDNTTPTTTTFSSSYLSKASTTYIAYCFAEKKGFSKFGSYTGNGSTDGTFVYTGFKPAWIMFKASSAVNDWVMVDTSRNTYNVANSTLYADLNAAEESPASAVVGVDILSNGFKLRDAKGFWNASGATFIYMAFAENPFVTSTSIPTTAR